jgi:cysteine-rich secretory family protein
MTRVLALLAFLGAVPQDAPDPKMVPEYLQKLGDDDRTVRKWAFDELHRFEDAQVREKTKRALATLGATHLKKASAERARAVRSLSQTARKEFKPAEFSAKQKELETLLKAGNTAKMEPIVREMWKEFYFDPAMCGLDVDVALTKYRVTEIIAWQKALNVPEKDALATQAADAWADVEEQALFQLFQPKDQKIMLANMDLREKIRIEEYRQIWQTNLYRILLGKAPLKINANLCDAARDHSKDMFELKFFAHESPVPGKRTPGDRAQRFKASASGENIFMGDASPEGAFWAWFKSLGHHQNMVREYAEIGVGHHEKYWTQMFG